MQRKKPAFVPGDVVLRGNPASMPAKNWRERIGVGEVFVRGPGTLARPPLVFSKTVVAKALLCVTHVFSYWRHFVVEEHFRLAI